MTPRILPADVYDALELSALACKGIGYACVGVCDTPECVLGHAAFLDTGESDAYSAFGTLGPCTAAVVKALSADGSWLSAGRSNDEAVAAINARLGRDRFKRVPFAKWCKELGVVRGK